MIRNLLRKRLRWLWTALVLLALAAVAALPSRAEPNAAAAPAADALPQVQQATPVYYKVQASGNRVELVVNTSRILTLDQRIPQLQVANPEILDLSPLSPQQVRVSAKRPGVTQVDLWGEDKRVYTIDVVVTPDARELIQILRAKFPNASLEVTPFTNSVLIGGYVDQRDAVPTISQIAEQYYPKVLNTIKVSGVQQSMLHVKVMEVSRTKLRNLGFDFAKITNGNLLMSGVSGLISTAGGRAFGPPSGAPDNVVKFSVLSNGGESAFFGVMDALRQDSLAKVLSEPVLVANSGRPAYVLVGGEIGYQVNSGLSGTTVGWKEYGTRLDFVPIVLGNGRIHLDVRALVSQPDASNSIQNIPALKTRSVETGVEMRAGQTLAIAGLIEQRTEASNRGIPWISEVPYLGAPFRTVREDINEVELLVLVTPEIVEPMDASQVPPCGPGMETTSPNDWELFFKGHLEVPNCCLNGAGNCPTGARPGPGGNAPPDALPGQAVSSDREPSPDGAAAPCLRKDRQTPPNPAVTVANNPANPRISEPGFIGPIGYDVLK